MILLVGESTGGSPATSGDAKAYKSSGGYGSDILVVADPSWNKITQAVYHGGAGTIPLPYFVVLDSKMIIQYVGGGGGSPPYSQVATALKSITGADFGGGGTGGGCAGYCDGEGPGCFCDSQCHNYGDCCPDVCSVCGYCG